jgi:Xaa-Pro dipeptidase
MAHYAVADAAQLTALDRRAVQLMKDTSSTAGSGLLPVLLRAISEAGLAGASVGFDDLRLAAVVRDANPTMGAKDAANTVQSIRMVKTGDEIVLMRHAASCNERALLAAISTCTPGALWSDVVRAYNVATVQQDCRPFALFVGAGARSAGIRVDPDYEIRHGDQVCFDAMMTYQRYFADMQRTCVLGEPSSKLASYWTALMEGATAAYDGMRPGVSTRTLREVALDTVRKAGIPTFRHAFLHSLGLDHLELPAMYGGLVDFELEQGMMVNMDFEVCELGFGGVYFEETMLITANGAERIATIPRELIPL